MTLAIRNAARCAEIFNPKNSHKKKPNSKKKRVTFTIKATPLSYPLKTDLDRKLCAPSFRNVCLFAYKIIIASAVGYIPGLSNSGRLPGKAGGLPMIIIFPIYLHRAFFAILLDFNTLHGNKSILFSRGGPEGLFLPEGFLLKGRRRSSQLPSSLTGRVAGIPQPEPAPGTGHTSAQEILWHSRAGPGNGPARYRNGNGQTATPGRHPRPSRSCEEGGRRLTSGNEAEFNDL